MKKILNNYKTKKVTLISFLSGAILFAFFVFLLLYSFVSIFFNAKLIDVFGFETTIVQSSSMHPTIKKYEFVVITKANASQIKQNDIVVFLDNSKKIKIIHRVEKKIELNGEPLFKTKGDNNQFSDSNYRKQSDIYAKFAFKVPFVGLFITFLLSNFGIMTITINIWLLVFLQVAWRLEADDNIFNHNIFD